MTKVVYTTHPIDRFKIGEYEFAKGRLELTEEEAEAFDSLRQQLPPGIAAKIRKLDVSAAEALAAEFLASRSIQGVDTTANTPAAPQPTNADSGADSGMDPTPLGDAGDEATPPKKPLQFGKALGQ